MRHPPRKLVTAILLGQRIHSTSGSCGTMVIPSNFVVESLP
jgi:hypothetical protein